MSSFDSNSVTGVVLAGGKATRMGGVDKGLVEVAGLAMIDHVVRRLQPQTGAIVINANRSRESYASRGFPVVADAFGEYAGPLAGMAAGLARIDTDWAVTVPCDSPLVPGDLVAGLGAALIDSDADLAVAEGAGRWQPVFALLPRRLLPDLEAFLGEGGRKIDRWFGRHRVATANFDHAPDAFLNINAPEDKTALEERLAMSPDFGGPTPPEASRHG